MTPETLFSLASTAALAGWLVLILLPRWPILIAALRNGLIGLLSLLYASLILVYFFQAEGGGFNSIAEVRALFAHDGALVAGWVHYLAFDLFVGIWIAERSDAAGTSRLMQAPVLLATFMFGPLGLLIHLVASRAPAFALAPARKG